MSVTADLLVAAGYAANSETTIYTSTSLRTILDKYTIYNTHTGPVNYVVKLVPSGISAAASHVLLNKTVQAGENYTCPELIGHVLEPGGFISEVADTASKLVRRVSGRKVSS